MSRDSGDGGQDATPHKPNLISSLLSLFPASFRKRGNGNDASPGAVRPNDDFRSLPPSRGINNNNNNNNNDDGALPKLQGLRRDSFDRPNLTNSISEPNGFISEFSPYRRRVFDDDSICSLAGLSLNGAYLNDGTLYYPKSPRPVSLELTSLDTSAGEGAPLHYFLVVQLSNLTWCDVCGGLIWGLVYQCLRCSYCRVTCHHHCRHLVDVDCHRRDVIDTLTTSSTNVSAIGPDLPAGSSSREFLPSSSTGYSSLDSSNVSSADDDIDHESTRPSMVSAAEKPVPRHKASRKVRPRLSNDLFAPKGLFDDCDDYDDSSGDSGHAPGSEGGLFHAGGDKTTSLNESWLDRDDDDDISTSLDPRVEEDAENDSSPPWKEVGSDGVEYIDDGVVDDFEHAEYIGSGGEIWMDGEKCESCDEERIPENDDFHFTAHNGASSGVGGVEKPVTVDANEERRRQNHRHRHKHRHRNHQNGKIAVKSNNEKSGKTKDKHSSHSKHRTNQSSLPSKPQCQHKHVGSTVISSSAKKHSSQRASPSNSTAAAAETTPARSVASPQSLLPGGQTMTKETLAKMVKEFNGRSKGLSLNVLEDGVTVRGFIRVHLDLMRPVNISSDRRLSLKPSGGECDSTGKSTIGSERTTFHIPQDTVKNLHITSETTVKEVVEALLKKYAVTDHPKKFALFEKTLHISDEGKHAISSRRLHDFECPLLIFLCWGGEMLNQRKFVLQENETGEILWEAFSLPELNTFLKILDHEELQYRREVLGKYDLYQRRLLEEMTKHEKNQGYSDC